MLQDVSSLPFNNSEAAVECGGGAGRKFGVDFMCYSQSYIAQMIQSLRYQLGNLSAIGYGPEQHPHVHFVACKPTPLSTVRPRCSCLWLRTAATELREDPSRSSEKMLAPPAGSV